MFTIFVFHTISVCYHFHYIPPPFHTISVFHTILYKSTAATLNTTGQPPRPTCYEAALHDVLPSSPYNHLLCLPSAAASSTTGQPTRPTCYGAALHAVLPSSPYNHLLCLPSAAASITTGQPTRPTCYGAALHAVLGALTPLCSYVPLTVAQLNAQSWAPRRDFETNHLNR